MILVRALWWLISLPFRVLFWLALLADDGGDPDAELGRRRLQGRNHPSAHLPRGVRQ